MFNKDEIYKKLLIKPFLFLMLVSIWPLLIYFIPVSWIIFKIVAYLDVLVFLQFYLLILFLKKTNDYFRFSKFESYEEANQFFKELYKVQRAEKINEKNAKKKENKLIRELRVENERLKRLKTNQDKRREIEELKKNLEERRKRVL